MLRPSLVTSLFVLSLASLPLAGCASLPEPVAARTGEPLSIQEQSGVSHVKVKEKVGEVRHTDSHGRTTGRSTVYADRIKTVHWHEWAPYQGSQKISDDDLYRLANDAAAEEEVRQKRQSGVTMNRIGIGGLLLGAAGVGTGLYLNSRETGDAESTTPGTYVLIGSAVVGSIGLTLISMGMGRTKEEHPLPQERAEAAAERYNRSLGNGGEAQTTGASLTR